MTRLIIPLVLCMFTCALAISQSNNTSLSSYQPDSWYQLYAKAYNQSRPSLCKTPSQLKTEIANIGCNTNAIQLVHMICNVSDIDDNPDGQISEQIDQASYSKQAVTGCGLVVPNLRIFDEDCKVNLHFPCIEICEDLKSQLQEESSVSSIRIYANNKLISQLACGETSRINLIDIFHKTLDFEINYNSGIQENFVYDTRTNPMLCYPDKCSFSDETIKVYPHCIGPPPPPVCPPPVGPPSFDECKIQPTYIDTIIATEPFEKHLPGNVLYTNYEDYFSYSREANPAVSTGIGKDKTNTLGAIKANVFVNPSRDQIARPIIITDGIDFFSNRNGTEILNENITSATLQLLFENDFDLIIADFDGGADFMQKNAFAFIELIKEIQSMETVDSIEAVVGPSMGGQIIRYALLYWESELLTRGEDPYKIKTFLSADSPWLGANASPALQVLAHIGKDTDLDIAEKLEIMDKLPNSPAARQLLLHHGAGYNQNVYRANPHVFRYDWVQEIAAMEASALPLDLENLVAIADGAVNGNTGGLVAPGNPILIYDVYEKFGPLIAEGELKLFAVQEDKDLIDYLGNWEDQIEKKLNIDDLPIPIESITIDGYDSYPGSPFRLSAYLGGLGINSLTIEDDFTFIPTYSALAIPYGEGNPELDLTTADSPVFDDYFADNTNSGHNDFLQEGTLDFFMNNVDGQETYLDACWYINRIFAQYNSPLCTYEQEEPVVSIENDFDSGGSTVQSNFSFVDMRLLDSNTGELVAPDVSSTIVSSNCKAGLNVQPIYDTSDNDKLVGLDIDYLQNWDDEYCSFEIEVCLSSPLCPSVEICEQIKVNVHVKGIPQFVSPGQDEEKLDLNQRSGSINKPSTMKIYPNPAKGEVSIQLQEGHQNLTIFRIDGTTHSKYNLDKVGSKFTCPLEKGTYIFMSYNVTTKSMYTEKVIII